MPKTKINIFNCYFFGDTRVKASFLLTKNNARLIGNTTIRPPASKLDKKFVNDGVIILIFIYFF